LDVLVSLVAIKQADDGVPTSSPLAVGVSKSSQPVRSRATIVQHIPEPNVLTTQKAASPAVRVKSRQEEGEKRGSPRPRGSVRRSTRSRSPARERHGYPRCEARRDNRPRSPRRMEHRATPSPSPGRRTSQVCARQLIKTDALNWRSVSVQVKISFFIFTRSLLVHLTRS